MNKDDGNCLIVAIVLVVVVASILPPARSVLAQSEESSSLYVFVSDLHLGVGRVQTTTTLKAWHRFEDFRWHGAFKQFLGYIDKQGGSNTTLVMIGDVFELWQSRDVKCEPSGAFIHCVVNDCVDADSRPPNLGCTEDELMVRLENIIANHKEIFDDLMAFLSKGENRLVIVPGNHDAGILYPRAIRRLSQLFGGQRFEFAESGYWFHEKLKVLAEHGHEFDLANKFINWPKPFASQNDKVYLQRPSGEQLVQHFYNSYEAQYPVLDNVTDELEAARIMTSETGAHGLFHGVSEFLKLLFLKMSFPQATAFLGDENKRGESIEWLLSNWQDEWAKDWTNPAFVVEAVAGYDDARQVAADAIRENKLDVKPSTLTTQQLRGLCELRQKLLEEKILKKSCPRKDEPKAGEIARRIFNVDPLPDYLRSRKRQLDSKLSGTSDLFLQPINLGGAVFDVFIYGHTHLAREAMQRNIDGWNVTVANTGAFQRVVTPSRLTALMESKKGKSLAEVNVEDLPDCYSFITVDPKLKKTQPELYYWVGSPDGTFRPEKGEKGCPNQ